MPPYELENCTTAEAGLAIPGELDVIFLGGVVGLPDNPPCDQRARKVERWDAAECSR